MKIEATYLDLLKKSIKFHNYMRVGLFLRICLFIVMAPFLLIYAISLFFYGLLILAIKAIDITSEYLLNFISSEGNKVKHGTQVVIYLIGFPLVFFAKVFIALGVFFLTGVHFITMIIGYVAMLRGIKFSLDPLTVADNYQASKEKLSKKETKGLIYAIIIAIILFILMIYSLLIENNNPGTFGFPVFITNIIYLTSILVIVFVCISNKDKEPEINN